MPPEDNQGGSPPNGTAADAAGQTTTTPQQQASDEPLRNFKEVVELRKETRETSKKLDAVLDMLKGVTPASKSEPVKADAKTPQSDLEARFAAMERQLALKDAYADLGIKPGDARELIESAIRGANAQKPEEIRSLVEKYAGLIKPTGTAATTQTEQTQVTQAVTQPKIPDGGPPSVDRKAHLPDDILAVPSAAWNAMTPAEKREFYENYKRKSGGGNPFAEKRGMPMIPKKG